MWPIFYEGLRRESGTLAAQDAAISDRSREIAITAEVVLLKAGVLKGALDKPCIREIAARENTTLEAAA